MKKSVIQTLILILLLALLFTGCGIEKTILTTDASKQETTAAKSETTTAPQKVKLRIAWWGSQERHDATTNVINLFKSKNQNYEFETEFSGWAGYFEKLTVQAAGNTMPDIIQQDYAYLDQYVQKGLLVDLSNETASKNLDISEVDTKIISSGKFNNKLYGIPLGVNALGLIYDPEIFKQAGATLPEPGWTWTDFEAAAVKIHSVLGDGNFACNGVPGGLDYRLRQNGKTMYSQSGTELGYTDDSIFTNYFTFQLKMQNAGIIPKPSELLAVKGLEDEFIVRGKAAMTVLWSNAIVALTTAAKRPLAMTLLPGGGPGSTPALYLKPSMFFSITKSSTNVSASAKFISFFINDNDASAFLMAERGVPVSARIRKVMETKLTAAQKVMFDYISLVEKNSSMLPPADPPYAAEVAQILTSITEEILYDKIKPDEGAAKFRKQANEILAKNKK